MSTQDTITFIGNEYTIRTFALMEGRHELPKNEGALVEAWSFSRRRATFSPKMQPLMQWVERGGNLRIYVTGLTPALIAVIQLINGLPKGRGRVFLSHFDRESGEYWEQII